MAKFSRVALIVGMLASTGTQAAQESDDARHVPLDQQAPVPDALINRQILQTLTDMRDSQLMILQTELEILSALRSQAQPPAAPPPHGEAPAPGH